MDFPTWNFISFVSDSCYICQTFQFEMNAWFFFAFVCYKSTSLSIRRNTKWDKQDRWSATDWHFIFVLQPLFSSSNWGDLKTAMMVYTVELDEKHGYSEGKLPLVHPNPVWFDFWWLFFWEYWYSPGRQWSCRWLVVWIVWMSISCKWDENILYEWDLNKYTYFCFLSYGINTLQQTSCSL